MAFFSHHVQKQLVCKWPSSLGFSGPPTPPLCLRECIFILQLGSSPILMSPLLPLKFIVCCSHIWLRDFPPPLLNSLFLHTNAESLWALFTNLCLQRFHSLQSVYFTKYSGSACPSPMNAESMFSPLVWVFVLAHISLIQFVVQVGQLKINCLRPHQAQELTHNYCSSKKVYF
jgi:hypothetical protein